MAYNARDYELQRQIVAESTRNAALEADNARLRSALQAFVNEVYGDEAYLPRGLQEAMRQARAALGHEQRVTHENE